MLDARAKEAYRRRLAEIDDDIAEARAVGDAERAVRSDAERDSLVQELAQAFWVAVVDARRPRPSALAPA